MPRPRIDCDRSHHTKRGGNKATLLDKALNTSAFQNSSLCWINTSCWGKFKPGTWNYYSEIYEPEVYLAIAHVNNLFLLEKFI